VCRLIPRTAELFPIVPEDQRIYWQSPFGTFAEVLGWEGGMFCLQSPKYLFDFKFTKMIERRAA
jgi:hypothetical protein